MVNKVVLSFFTLSLLLFISCDRFEDSSLDWEQIELSTESDFFKLELAPDSTLHIVGGELWDLGIHVYSNDFGNSWTIDSISEKPILSLDFDDQGLLYATGVDGFIYLKRSNQEWETVQPYHWGVFNDIEFTSFDNGLIVGGQAIINGYMVSYGKSLLLDSVHLSEREFRCIENIALDTWLIGGYGQVLRSIDNAGTWTVVNVDGGDNYIDMDFIDEQLGFLIGHSGSILKSENGGLNWSIKRDAYSLLTTNVSLNAVDFYDENIGAVVGADGLVIYTVDGGETWKEINDLPEEDYLDVLVLNQEIIVVGKNGLVLKVFL